MNLGEMHAEAGRLLGDPNNDRWSTSVLTIRLNEGARQFLLDTKAIKTKNTLTPVADTQTVTLDTDTLDIARVAITRENGDIVPLTGMSREELDIRHPNWQNLDAGEPDLWWYDGSAGNLYLVPKPDSANAISSGLIVWGIEKPTEMSGTSDDPFDSNSMIVAYHIAVVHWAVAQCWFDDGTPEGVRKALNHRSGSVSQPGEYEKIVKKALGTFDKPLSIPKRIIWTPQGGRLGGGKLSKRDPLGSSW